MAWWEEQHDKVTSEGLTGLRKTNMNKYFKYRDDAVRYVIGLLKRSEFASPLTITISPAKSAGYSVLIATTVSSDDTRMDVC